MDPAGADKPTSEELIRDCIRKDRRAWDIFVERYSKVVYWAIRDRLRRFGYDFNDSDVEDIHQDVFISLWAGKALAQIKDRTKIAGWIAMVAGNAAIDYFKRLRRQSPPNSISLFKEIYADSDGESKALEDILPSKDEAPDEQAQLKEVYQIIEDEIDSLNAKEKIIIKLNLLHGMRHREISEALKMSIDTVSTTIARTKEQLKGKLRRKGLSDF